MRAAERRDRHPPDALARQTPVGARLDHAADTVFTPGGDPFGDCDLRERPVAQRGFVVGSAETGKPLQRGAEDDRLLATPAAGVLVPDRLANLVEKQTARGQ